MSSFATFLDTFGYVVLRNVYDKNLVGELRAAYDEVVTSQTGKTIEQFLNDPRPIPAGVEMSQEFDELIGDDAIFWGSDLSTFKSASQFHRDTLGDYKLLKVAIYLQDSTPQDGGHFVCIPGSHHFGDRYSHLCSRGLMWPHGAGYAGTEFTGEFDYNKPCLQNNIPALKIDLAVGDILFFHNSLVHAVPASSRPRRLIALSFLEGAKSFNSRPRPPGEFTGLTHDETYIAMRVALFIVETRLGMGPFLHYHEKLAGFEISRLKKYLRTFSDEQFEETHARVFKHSYEAAFRFVTKSEPR
jgi:ectoine hydroxylase-related dioxygenase (phytanoyl-CoA dioxygenase family)